MNPFWEKLIMLGASVALALLAYAVKDDPAIRTLLLSMTSGPTFAAFYPRARERELKRELDRARQSHDPDQTPTLPRGRRR